MMLMQGKKAGYSLMEVLAVVAIVVFLLTVGLVNYLKVRDRQRLENAARELIVYFNSMAQKARLGNRGGGVGTCSKVDPGSAENIATGNCKLSHWQIAGLKPTAGGVSELKPQVFFYDKQEAARGEQAHETHNFTLPQDVTLHTVSKDVLVFDSLYGLIYVKDGLAAVGEKHKADFEHANERFILTDGDLYYVFLLENGTFTHGCFCQNNTDCEGQTC